MPLIGAFLFVLGLAIVVFNKRIARRLSSTPRRSEVIKTSVTRQNLIIIAVVLMLGGIAFLFIR